MLGLPSRVSACLFDLDGVLTPTATLHAAAWQRTFEELHLPFDPVADYLAYVDGKPRRDGVMSFLAARRVTMPGAEIDRIAERKDDFFVQLLHDQAIAPYPGSLRYLHAVREHGLATAVVSSSRHTREVLQAARIADQLDACIDGIVAEKKHLAGKPAPDTYLAAARALGVDPDHAAVFEDARAGVAAGRAGHFARVIGVDHAGHAAELLQHGADVVVDDLAKLLEAP